MLRRLFLPAFSLLVPLSAALIACSVSAAAFSNDDSAGADAAPTGDNSPASSLVNSGRAKEDAAVGNPICGVTSGSCWPDDDGVRALASDTKACAPAVADGGAPKAPSADASTKVSACRVAPNGGVPQCNGGSGDTRGVDGVACQTGDDCAPGFDCVDGDNGAVCRRYCCSGTCDGYPAANNGPTFCFVQPVNRADVTGGDRPNAPVCMPIKSCTLLEDGDCTDQETCAIVNDEGATGCVPTGDARVTEPCDTVHCQAGLTCLGSPGNRTCYQLCRTNGGSDCASNETCTTGAAFQDTSYGICKTQH